MEIKISGPFNSQINLADHQELQTPLGKVVWNLASNGFTDTDVALDFTIKKIEWLNQQGVVCSARLPATHVRKIATQVNILQLRLDIRSLSEQLEEKFIDFSILSESDLIKIEAELEEKLQDLKLKRRVAIETAAFKQLLNELIQEFPSQSSSNENLERSFEEELSHLALADISEVAQEKIDSIQINAKAVRDLLNSYRTFLIELAKDSDLEKSEEFAERQIDNFLIHHPFFEDLYLSNHEFKIHILNAWEAQLNSKDNHQRLKAQLDNQANTRAWESMLKDLQAEILQVAHNQFSLDHLTEEQQQSLQLEILKLSEQGNVNFDQDKKDFEESVINPVAEQVRSQFVNLLEPLKNHEVNLIALLRLFEDYKQFLRKTAQEKHEFTPSEEVIKEHLRNATSFSEKVMDFLNQFPLQFEKEFLDPMKAGFYDVETIYEWSIRVSNSKKNQAFVQNPTAFVEKVYDHEIKPTGGKSDSLRQQHIEAVVSVLKESTTELNEKAKQTINDCIYSLRGMINEVEMEDLEERLRNNPKIKQSIIEDILTNKKWINPLVISNQEVLDEKQKLEIIQKAENESELSSTLSQIKEDLKEKRLTPNSKVIESKYKQLEKLMRGFPLSFRDSYHIIVNKAKLEQELLKRKNLKRAPFVEKLVLDKLGFNPIPIDFEQLATKKLIADLLGSEHLSQKNETQLQKEIEEAEFTERLKARGLTDAQIPNMKLFIQEIKQLKTHLISHFTSIIEKEIGLDFLISLPHAHQSLIKMRAYAIDLQIKSLIESHIQQIASQVKTYLSDPAEFKSKILDTLAKGKFLSQNLEAKTIEAIKNQLQMKLNFYHKWSKDIKISSIQGLTDANEVLGKGVCQAKCMRVGKYEEENPEASVMEIGADRIIAVDRFFQAQYSRTCDDVFKTTREMKEILNSHLAIPKDLMQRFGYSELKWFVTTDFSTDKRTPITDIREQFLILGKEDQKEMLKESSGVLHIGIAGENWGHALHVRIDLERRIFRFHDPNVGVIEITIRAEEMAMVGTRKLAEFWEDLIRTFYPDTSGADMFQLLK